jgi:large subunit ribosomal protein L13
MGDVVIVKNIKNIKVSGKKADQKKYYHHSLYLGGLKEITFKKLFEKNPAEVLRKAVFGMMPINSLREEQIKRLRIEK